jgi:Zn-dependent protease with chaperone function
MFRYLFPSAAALLLTLGGCAAPSTQRVSVSAQQTAAEAQKQMDIVAEEFVSERARLNRIHWQVVTSSVSLCPKVTQLSGIDVLARPKGDLGESLGRLYGVMPEPTILSIVPASPADKAGLQPRDIVLSVYGLPLSNSDAIRQRARAAKPGEPMPVQVRRAGQAHAITVTPVPACDYPATLVQQQVLNAYADGERIFLTRGMMAFARTDEELALVVAHEIAHNTMRHIDAKKANAAAGLVGDLALAILSRGAYRQSTITEAASQAYSQEFEAEADYVGLYMLANSGFSVDEAPKFWRRMAAANPGNIKGTHTASHPPTSYRMVALEEAAKEIQLKRSTSAALVPVRKDGMAFVPGQGLMPGGNGQGPAETANCFLGTDGRCTRR